MSFLALFRYSLISIFSLIAGLANSALIELISSPIYCQIYHQSWHTGVWKGNKVLKQNQRNTCVNSLLDEIKTVTDTLVNLHSKEGLPKWRSITRHLCHACRWSNYRHFNRRINSLLFFNRRQLYYKNEIIIFFIINEDSVCSAAKFWNMLMKLMNSPRANFVRLS